MPDLSLYRRGWASIALEINGALMDTYHRWLEVSLPASLGGLPTISLPPPPVTRAGELAFNSWQAADVTPGTELASAIESLITG